MIYGCFVSVSSSFLRLMLFPPALPNFIFSFLFVIWRVVKVTFMLKWSLMGLVNRTWVHSWFFFFSLLRLFRQSMQCGMRYGIAIQNLKMLLDAYGKFHEISYDINKKEYWVCIGALNSFFLFFFLSFYFSSQFLNPFMLIFAICTASVPIIWKRKK